MQDDQCWACGAGAWGGPMEPGTMHLHTSLLPALRPPPEWKRFSFLPFQPYQFSRPASFVKPSWTVYQTDGHLIPLRFIQCLSKISTNLTFLPNHKLFESGDYDMHFLNSSGLQPSATQQMLIWATLTWPGLSKGRVLGSVQHQALSRDW